MYPQDQSTGDCQAIAYHYRFEGSLVQRGFILAEEVRSSHVPAAISQEQNSCYRHFLGYAAVVGLYKCHVEGHRRRSAREEEVGKKVNSMRNFAAVVNDGTSKKTWQDDSDDQETI